MDKPHVHIIGTGGTIAGKQQASGTVAPGLTAEELKERVPPAARHARLSAESFLQVASSEIGLPEMMSLAKRITEVFSDPDVAGIVVTHGTGTLEQTVYFLDVTLAEERPVVVTGAMRNPTLISDDGPMNLLNAILVAASPRSRGLGVLMTLNNFIHCARDVRKRHSADLHAFGSPEFGALGAIDEESVYYARRPFKRLPAVMPEAMTAQVELIPSTAGASDLFLRAALDAEIDGLVIEGGKLNPQELELVKGGMERGMVVVMCNPYPTGRLHVNTYRHKGGESDLLDQGIIFAGTPGLKARIKLAVLISAGLSREEIRGHFHAEWQ